MIILTRSLMGGGRKSLIDFDLQRFSQVSNPYTFNLAQDFKASASVVIDSFNDYTEITDGTSVDIDITTNYGSNRFTVFLKNKDGFSFSDQINITQPVNIQNNPGKLHISFGTTWSGSNYYITEMSYLINGNSRSVSPRMSTTPTDTASRIYSDKWYVKVVRQ